MTMTTTGKTARIIRGGLATAAALGAAGLLAACSGTPAPAASAPAPATTSPTATSPVGSPAAATGADDADDQASSVSSPKGPKYCKAADLNVAFAEGNGAGMSHDNVNLRFTNKSRQTCDLQGSPGVSFVAGTDGHQVGAPATRQPKSQGKLQVLTPGKSAQASLTFVSADAFPPEQCTKVDVNGLRVYAPGDTASMFLPKSLQACANLATVLMDVNTVA
jgi:hypothetical protein